STAAGGTGRWSEAVARGRGGLRLRRNGAGVVPVGQPGGTAGRLVRVRGGDAIRRLEVVPRPPRRGGDYGRGGGGGYRRTYGLGPPGYGPGPPMMTRGGGPAGPLPFPSSSANPNDEDAVSAVYVTGDPPGKRAGHTATGVGRRIYVFGGSCGTDYLNDFFVLDTDPTPRRPDQRAAQPGPVRVPPPSLLQRRGVQRRDLPRRGAGGPRPQARPGERIGQGDDRDTQLHVRDVFDDDGVRLHGTAAVHQHIRGRRRDGDVVAGRERRRNGRRGGRGERHGPGHQPPRALRPVLPLQPQAEHGGAAPACGQRGDPPVPEAGGAEDERGAAGGVLQVLREEPVGSERVTDGGFPPGLSAGEKGRGTGTERDGMAFWRPDLKTKGANQTAPCGSTGTLTLEPHGLLLDSPPRVSLSFASAPPSRNRRQAQTQIIIFCWPS
ncbi:hypothetical protein THAOC_18844, partial [Thalassiosira oceanica]